MQSFDSQDPVDRNLQFQQHQASRIGNNAFTMRNHSILHQSSVPMGPGRSLVGRIGTRPPGAEEYSLINQWTNRLVSFRHGVRIPRPPNILNVDLNGLRTGASSLVTSLTSFGTTINSFGSITGQGVGSISQLASAGFYALYMKGGEMFNGLRSRMPKWQNWYYSLMFLTFNPSYAPTQDTDAFDDLLITTSNESSVQYYSHDLIENMKIKVVLREIDLFSSPSGAQMHDSGEHSPQQHIDERYKTHAFIVGWQQKIFSPCEILMYHKLDDPQTALDRMYVEDVKRLIGSVGCIDDAAMEMSLPYLQDITHELRAAGEELNQLSHSRQMKKREEKSSAKRMAMGSDGEASPNNDRNRDEEQHEDETEIRSSIDNNHRRSRRRRRRRRRRRTDKSNHTTDDERQERSDSDSDDVKDFRGRGTSVQGRRRKTFEQFTDMLNHPLFTYVHNDPFETDTIQLPFYNNSNRFQTTPKQSNQQGHLGKKPRKMYIMANFGKVSTSVI